MQNLNQKPKKASSGRRSASNKVRSPTNFTIKKKEPNPDDFYVGVETLKERRIYKKTNRVKIKNRQLKDATKEKNRQEIKRTTLVKNLNEPKVKKDDPITREDYHWIIKKNLMKLMDHPRRPQPTSAKRAIQEEVVAHKVSTGKSKVPIIKNPNPTKADSVEPKHSAKKHSAGYQKVTQKNLFDILFKPTHESTLQALRKSNNKSKLDIVFARKSTGETQSKPKGRPVTSIITRDEEIEALRLNLEKVHKVKSAFTRNANKELVVIPKSNTEELKQPKKTPKSRLTKKSSEKSKRVMEKTERVLIPNLS